MDEIREYATFHITTQTGVQVELAIIDEFEFENKSYVAAALVEDDTISDEGVFIYRVKLLEDDFKVETIKSQVDYERVAEAYMEMTELLN